MTNLKEKIARAIDPIAWEDGEGMPTDWARFGWQTDRAISLKLAQAALEAMLEPETWFLDKVYPYSNDSRDELETLWNNAIKAAIAER